jgi:hypothetical protein
MVYSKLYHERGCLFKRAFFYWILIYMESSTGETAGEGIRQRWLSRRSRGTQWGINKNYPVYIIFNSLGIYQLIWLRVRSSLSTLAKLRNWRRPFLENWKICNCSLTMKMDSMFIFQSPCSGAFFPGIPPLYCSPIFALFLPLLVTHLRTASLGRGKMDSTITSFREAK